VVTRAEVEALDVVAPPDKAERAVNRLSHRRPDAKEWLRYQRYVEIVPPSGEGDCPDRSRADFPFCPLAINSGRAVEETTDRLLQESP
jgi:hypothetical protein